MLNHAPVDKLRTRSVHTVSVSWHCFILYWVLEYQNQLKSWPIACLFHTVWRYDLWRHDTWHCTDCIGDTLMMYRASTTSAFKVYYAQHIDPVGVDRHYWHTSRLTRLSRLIYLGHIPPPDFWLVAVKHRGCRPGAWVHSWWRSDTFLTLTPCACTSTIYTDASPLLANIAPPSSQ